MNRTSYLSIVLAVIATGCSAAPSDSDDVARSAQSLTVSTWDPIPANNPGKVMITAIARHPLYPSVAWVGYSDGALFRTNDSTSAAPVWTRVDQVETDYRLPDRAITDIAIDRDNQIVYVTLKGPSSTPNLWKTTTTGMRWSPVAALASAGTLLSVSQNPLLGSQLFVTDEFANVYCSSDAGASFGVTNCAWSKLTPADPSAKITSIERDPGSVPAVVVGFSNGELYRTSNAAAASPTWVRMDLRGTDRLFPAGAITQITAPDVDGARCILVRAAGSQLWCGGGAPNGFFSDVQGTLPKFSFIGFARHPRSGRLYGLTRYSGSVGSEDNKGAWNYTDRLLRVDYVDGDHGAYQGQWLKPRLRLVNEGASAVQLSGLTMRYWYGQDEAQVVSEVVGVDYATVGAGNLSATASTTSVGGPASPPSYADRNVKVTFLSGQVAPMASTDVELSIHKSGWQSYDERNDYSYVMNRSSYSPHLFVGLYRDGHLIWGNDPFYSANE